MQEQPATRPIARSRAECVMTLQGGVGLAAVWLAVAFGTAAPCRADLIIQAPTVTTAPGSTGSFDVLIENTNPTGGQSYQLYADVIELSLTGLSGVAFTGVSIATLSAPYVYVDSGTTEGGGPFSFDNFPNTQFDASDSEFGPAGYRSIDPQDVFGLANVTYTVSADASLATGSLVIGPDTSLSDPSFNDIIFTAENGSFTVISSAIPEPSSLALAMIGLAAAVTCCFARTYARNRHAIG